MAEGGVLEGFDDGGHGIEHDDGAKGFVGDHADGVDDRGAVHPKGDDEGEQDGEVAVFGGHGGNQDAEAQAEAGYHDDEDGEQG